MFVEYYDKIVIGICVFCVFLSLFSEEEGTIPAVLGFCAAYLAYFYLWADSKGATVLVGATIALLAGLGAVVGARGEGKTESETLACPDCEGKGTGYVGTFGQWPTPQACSRCGGSIERSKHVVGGYYTSEKQRPGSGKIRIVRKYDKEGKLLSEVEKPG